MPRKRVGHLRGTMGRQRCRRDMLAQASLGQGVAYPSGSRICCRRPGTVHAQSRRLDDQSRGGKAAGHVDQEREGHGGKLWCPIRDFPAEGDPSSCSLQARQSKTLGARSIQVPLGFSYCRVAGTRCLGSQDRRRPPRDSVQNHRRHATRCSHWNAPPVESASGRYHGGYPAGARQRPPPCRC